jgi:hypothetical protein
VLRARNYAEAGMIKELLQDQGLLVMIRSAGLPHAAFGGQVEVLVPAEKAAAAEEIVRAFTAPAEE